jgi:hypothetical protein
MRYTAGVSFDQRWQRICQDGRLVGLVYAETGVWHDHDGIGNPTGPMPADFAAPLQAAVVAQSGSVDALPTPRAIREQERAAA